MKKLNELFNCENDILIESIEEDSRVTKNNILFCCIEGLTSDGHEFVEQAIENGAVAIVARKDINVSVPVIKVEDTNRAMNKALSKFYDEPEKELKLIGITGTDGKTTLSSIVYQLINSFDNCGYIGTNGIVCRSFAKENKWTTPFPKDLFRMFKDFKDASCNYVSMEASSERLGTKRLDGINYDVTVFTNITRDHLNNHKTMENYIAAKSRLFQFTKDNGYAIINNDDDYTEEIKKAATGNIITYGIKNKSDVFATDVIIAENKLMFNLSYNNQTYNIVSPLSGIFNVYNLMAAITVCTVLGFDINKVINAVKDLKPIKARLELIDYGQPYKIMIDYAHTANALKNLLEYVNVISNGNIITVTGSAGGRDKGKRPDMGEVVTNLSSHVIFTMDDPRKEDPNDIIDEMISTIKDKKNNYERVVDRGIAIRKALAMAKDGDIVIIAGKGSDPYMAIGDEYVPYNDFDEVRKFFIKEV